MIPVLYVDDDPALLAFGKQYLETTNEFMVDTALTADAASEFIRESPYSAIISGNHLPDLDGIAFLRQVRKMANCAPFILFVAGGSEDLAMTALNEGADFYCKKNADTQTMFAELARAIPVAMARCCTPSSGGTAGPDVVNTDRFHELFSNMSSGAAIYTATDDGTDFIIRDFNRAAESIDHLRREDVIGRRVTEVFPAVAEFGLLDIFSRVLRTGRPEHHPVSLYRDARIQGWRENFVYRLSSGEIVALYDDITGWKQEEEALQKSEEKYRILADASRDFVYIIDADDNVAYVNRHGLAMLNKRLEEVAGRPRKDLFPEKSAGMQYQNLRQVFESGRPLRNESRIPMPGGMTWQDTYLVPLTAEDGTVTAVMGVSRDITERKEATEALRRSEEKFRAYIENSPIGIFVIDPAGTYIDVNEAACRLTGYGRDELVKLPVSRIVPDETRAGLEDRFAELNTTGRLSRELPLKRKDGTIISMTLDAVRLPDGKSVAFCTDITERKKAEDLIRENLERYRLILKSANEGIMVNELTDKGPGKFIEVNESALRILGITRDEMQELSLADLGSPELKTRYLAFTQEMEINGHIMFRTDYRAKDGTDRYLAISSSRFMLAGKPAILSVVRDITEQKKTELALMHANKKLNLLTGITRHDIRNQLLTLNAYLVLAREPRGDPEKRKDLLQNAEEITKNIERQILFTREYERLGTNIPEWRNVQECIRHAAGELDLTGIDLLIGDMEGVGIFADNLIQKVFFNLLDNSLRHGGADMTRITFSYRKKESGLEILYEDDGTGIPQDEEEIIFDRGYGKNTGFGLFFIREILAITAITITENGEPGKGARFVIAVPAGAWRIQKTCP
jgi:PAS domain S-box-containing protein